MENWLQHAIIFPQVPTFLYNILIDFVCVSAQKPKQYFCAMRQLSTTVTAAILYVDLLRVFTSTVVMIFYDSCLNGHFGV